MRRIVFTVTVKIVAESVMTDFYSVRYLIAKVMLLRALNVRNIAEKT